MIKGIKRSQTNSTPSCRGVVRFGLNIPHKLYNTTSAHTSPACKHSPTSRSCAQLSWLVRDVPYTTRSRLGYYPFRAASSVHCCSSAREMLPARPLRAEPLDVVEGTRRLHQRCELILGQLLVPVGVVPGEVQRRRGSGTSGGSNTQSSVRAEFCAEPRQCAGWIVQCPFAGKYAGREAC